MRRIVATLLFFSLTATGQQRTPLILDTDLGDAIDDAMAVAFALNSPELEIRAVTTVIDDVDLKTRLAWKLLGLYNRRGIPLARGASEPLLAPKLPTRSRQYEVLTGADTIPEPAFQPAAELFVDTIRQSRDKITVVAIGPLTNIALALKLDPAIKSNIERIVLMGGAYRSQQAEYNIQRDPAAAEIVFRSGIPITAVGLEVTSPLRLRERDLDQLRLASDPRGLFLLRLLDLAGEERPTLFDPLALAVIVRPNLVEFQEGAVSVSLADGRTTFSPASGSRTAVGVKVDDHAALDFILERVTRGSGR